MVIGENVLFCISCIW